MPDTPIGSANQQSLPAARLMLGPHHVPGIDLARLVSLVQGALVDNRPVEVVHAAGGFYEIRNGRHRFLRDVVLGKRFVDCHLVPDRSTA